MRSPGTRLVAWVQANRTKRSALESHWRGVDAKAAKSAVDAKAADEERRKKIKEQIADIRGSNGK